MTAPAATDDDRRGPAREASCTITWRRDWAPHLFSFRTTRPAGLDFAPGQFVRLGTTGADGAIVRRAYSIASAPADPELEFYSIVVPDGPFTPPLARLVVGDAITVDPTVYGFLRADRFTAARVLWLLATGTGIAPFRAMLADGTIARRFADVVVVHGVRTARELAYRADFEGWTRRSEGARIRYLPALTGDEPHDPTVSRGRITALIASGALERAVGLPIDAVHSRLMIAGNPSMIRETRALLNARGLSPVRRDTPGHYIVENFW